MTRDEIYAIWNPPESPWSAWTKPVLFSYLREQDLRNSDLHSLKPWDVPSVKGSAVIVDVPGVEGLAVGVALCMSGGFRPIPAYNACPFAAYGVGLSIVADPSKPQTYIPTAVDYAPILSSLAAASERLAGAKLPAVAPPAFLLDGNRKGRGRIMLSESGWFDNRSRVSESDFPSSQVLQEHRLSTVILIQNNRRVQWDLLEVLLSWQRGGILIALQRPWEPWNPRPVTLKPPSMVARFWHWLAQSGGLRGDSGPFGQYVPPSTS
jgi:hypothetical protein